MCMFLITSAVSLCQIENLQLDVPSHSSCVFDVETIVRHIPLINWLLLRIELTLVLLRLAARSLPNVEAEFLQKIAPAKPFRLRQQVAGMHAIHDYPMS